ncbi:hypothetical protein ACFQGT_09065 [Natrialbaceae archaeon GCM10025810]|uniref:hypothetical protein n=1 Tax=Halovalidus salilacus TaxID=3075124 RepID=UPI00360BDA66
MASQNGDDRAVSIALPGDVADWIDAVADEREERPEDVCRRLVVAVHAATDDEFAPASADDLADLEETLTDDLESRRAEFRDLLEDVRERVIQVKREADAKAPADHAHPEHATVDDLSSVESDLRALERTVESGFDNFESVLDHLVSRTDELEDRSNALARALLDLRDHRNALAERRRRAAEVESLRRSANRLGVRTATCEACDSRVDLGLLADPTCPHCARSFAEVEPKTSFFGSPTLLTGDPPALEGRVERAVDPEPSTALDAVESELDADGTESVDATGDATNDATEGTTRDATRGETGRPTGGDAE